MAFNADRLAKEYQKKLDEIEAAKKMREFQQFQQRHNKPTPMPLPDYLDMPFKQEFPDLKDLIGRKPIMDPPIRKTVDNGPVPSMTREEFYEKIIKCGPNGEHRRLVAWRDIDKAEQILLEEKAKNPDGYGVTIHREVETNTRLWVPDGPEEEFNLVTSLCTDGLHRPLFDLDFTKDQLKFQQTKNKLTGYIQHNGSQTQIKFPEGTNYIIDSTHHCHVYIQQGMYLTTYLEALGEIPGEDARKYKTNVENFGRGSLRPPWIKKAS